MNIGKRLETVAALAAVRLCREEKGAKLTAVDVGTDHAKLPIYLVASGEFSHVTATDINKGPVLTARKNVALAGKKYTDAIDIVMTDGLDGVEGVCPDRIIIAGMGGELIRDIIDRAPFVKEHSESIMLVLQPQSREQLLRRYLNTAGFRILDEKFVCENGKYYPIIACVYDGIPRDFSLMDIYFGTPNLKAPNKDFLDFFAKKKAILKKNAEKRAMSAARSENELFSEEQELLAEMEKYEHAREE